MAEILTAGLDSESDFQAELEVTPPSASLRRDGGDACSEKKERLEAGRERESRENEKSRGVNPPQAVQSRRLNRN